MRFNILQFNRHAEQKRGRHHGFIVCGFIKLVAIAIFISSPIAWLAMHKCLKGYDYHISIPLWIFFLAGGMALVIALLTISFQSVKAARANPVNSLRSE